MILKQSTGELSCPVLWHQVYWKQPHHCSPWISPIFFFSFPKWLFRNRDIWWPWHALTSWHLISLQYASGTFLPKGFLRAARFHSCLLWSQAVRPINQPRSLPWDMEHEKKQPWDFQVPCCLAKMLEAFMLGPSQYFRAPGLPPVHLGAGLQSQLLLPGLSGSAAENSTAPEWQGCSDSPFSDRKTGSLHR